LDADGNLLLEGQGDFRSRIYGSFHTELNQPIVGGFFKQSELLPGISHELSLSLDRFHGRATKVKVRLGTHAPEIREVVLRSYALVGRSEGFDEYLWDRTSPTWRERLTRTNLYPPELVSELERQNLLRYRWSSVPPSGIDGTDYEERILCLFRDFHEPTRIESLPIALINPVGPHWRSGIPLPDPAGTLRLEFTWHEISEALPDGLPVGAVVRWHAPQAARNTTAAAIPESQVSEIELSVEGGMIEIESPHLAEVRAWWRPEGQTLEQVLQSNGGLQKVALERLTPVGEVDITPEPIIRKAYRTDPGTTVDFSVSHLSGESTPLRVILQQPINSDDREAATGSPKLTWEFLDLQGQVTHFGVIEHAAPLSEYERIDAQTPIQNVGEPATRYFAVPDHVSVVRFGSIEHSMLVSVATRPPDLPFVREIGEKLDPLVEEEQERIWFPLIPNQLVELAEQQRTQVVYLRRRPPESPQNISGDRLRWDSFTPTTTWIARKLLVPWVPQTETPPEMLSIVFQQLQPGVEYQARFPAASGVRQVSPRLVWSDVPVIPQTLSVFIDGKLHEEVRILSSSGRSDLASFPTTDDALHRIEIRAKDAFPVYLSGLEPGVGPARLQRLALRWSSPELVFDYEKLSPGEELLQLKLFQTARAATGSEISCELTQIQPREVGPFDSWTLCRRKFQLSPAAEPRALVLDAAGEKVEEGRLCVIPLGSDLPPGRYRLRVRRETGDVGYLLLFRRTPESAPLRVLELLTNVDSEASL
ncbi:MAG TPA: hypothetical protein VMM56_14550, partial [Planctomycetaceae bacterium]|nr:hypothetical protein [Planctomycetaceae bacterium]